MMKNLDNIPKTNKEYSSVVYDCSRFIDSFRFLSSFLGSIVVALVDYIYKRLKKLKRETVGDDIMLSNVNEMETMINEVTTIEDFKMEIANEFVEKLEEVIFFIYLKMILKRWKKNFPISGIIYLRT